jgi:hypothetical protein
MAKDFFLGEPALDKMMTVLVSLSRETYVLKDRMSLMESLLNKKGCVTQEDFETHVMSDAELKAAKQKSDDFVRTIFSPLLDEAPLIKRKSKV